MRTPARLAGGKGHAVIAAFIGFFLFFFIGMDLLFFGVIPLKSPLITILPLVGIVVGILWGWWAPLGRRPTPTPIATAPSPPWREPATAVDAKPVAPEPLPPEPPAHPVDAGTDATASRDELGTTPSTVPPPPPPPPP